MSTRFYPKYVAGNPQLRIFLPDFWMILARNRSKHLPKNRVAFKTHPRMTDWDIKNYLEKIYKLPVVDVRSAIISGRMPKAPGQNYVIKEPDYRMAYVTLPKEIQFTHPERDLFCLLEKDEMAELQKKEQEMMKTGEEENLRKHWDRKDVPTWFS